MTRSSCAAVAVLALALAGTAQATEAPIAQVRALARQAQHDPAALATLRKIDVVDGRPIPIAAALGNASGPALQARLRVLAAGAAASPASSSAGSQEEARRILSGRRYRGSPVPQPFHRPLAWLGRELSRASRWADISIPWTGGTFNALWLILGLAIVGLAAFVVWRLGRRRGGLRIERGGDGSGGRAPVDDPNGLDRLADDAERAGDLSGALRLRFRAGLLRLARARAIPSRSSVTTGEVRRALRSPDFDELARNFDEVVYGRRNAQPADLDRARAGWPRVLETARSK